MGLELEEALRRLCVEIGWSYAVFWRAVGFPSAKCLVWGGGHWYGKMQISESDVNFHVNILADLRSVGVGEGSIDELVNKTMVPQVHVIGVGIVGQAASTGNHRWILRNVTDDNESTLKNFPDVNNQFLAGIQTIVIIPIFPHGVVQFGSNKRVMENLLFVNHVKTSFMQLALEQKSSIYDSTSNSFGQNNFPRPSISPRIFDHLLRDNCSNVDRSLSHCSSSLSTLIKGKSSKVEASMPTIHQARSNLFHPNKQLEDELFEARMKSNVDLMSGSRIQEPAITVKASVDGMFVGFDTDSLIKKIEPICANQPAMIADINSLNGNQSISINSGKESSLSFMPNEKSLTFPQLATSSGDDLFDVLGLYASLDGDKANKHQLTELNLSPVNYPMYDDISYTEIFSESNTDQLLDAVVSNIYHGARQSLDEVSAKKVSGPPIPSASPSNESGKNINSDTSFASLGKRVDEMAKPNRKRARPGESSKPRPKDRQLIMDRVKELREIVPNGAKCSIDALLEKTIKHMLFLQNVSKHAEKLKKTGEPKIISKDGVVALKDNFRGGATWAFEVGSHSMTCPIIVEDLNPPREMLVEMLCEERGLFLEIADLIRGLGLTILKGVMEARRDKIWARFAVEANRDVTRMEIFLSIVHLLEPTIGSGVTPHSILSSNYMPHKIFNLACVPATGISDPLH